MTVRVPSAANRRIRLDEPSLFILLTTYDEPLLPSNRTTAPLTGIRTSPSTTVLPSRWGMATSAPRGKCAGLDLLGRRDRGGVGRQHGHHGEDAQDGEDEKGREGEREAGHAW